MEFFNRNAFSDGYHDAINSFTDTNTYNRGSASWKRYNLGYLKGTIELHKGESDESKRDSCDSIKISQSS